MLSPTYRCAGALDEDDLCGYNFLMAKNNDKIRKYRGLRLIEGGLPDKEDAEKEFVSAFATDTRLMGEIAMGIHWKILDHPEAEDLYQFFSFDVQECGLDNYKSSWASDIDAISYIRQTLVGPLGGEDVIISEREARALFTKYRQKCLDADLPLPEGRREYAFLEKDPVVLSDKEYDDLFCRLCTPLTCDNQVINYFLMRVFSCDYEGAAYLAAEGMDVDLYPEMSYALLCKNTIEKNGGLYVCRSLVEYRNGHRLISCELTVEDGLVTSHRRVSDMPVTVREASMMLTRSEFITAFRIMAEPETFEEQPLEFNYNTMVTEHDNGRLYMAFHNNNDHVKKSIYRLSDDVLGLYFITPGGEFIVAAYDEETIIRLERELIHGPIGFLLVPVAKFEFKDPILYDFANSDFDDFLEFVSLLTEE